MTLYDFIAKMKKNKYSNEYVQEISEDNKTVFMDWNNKIYDVTGYTNNDHQITHACLERHINKKVEVINFVRDIREDWGDDGGYCFYVGKYNDKYVFGSNYISYNSDFSQEFINVDKLEDGDENVEYVFFDTLLEVDAFIEKIIAKTKELTAEDEDWGYESWDLEEEDFESPFMHLCIRNLGSAFCEYADKNILNLISLTDSNVYIPRYLDPQEFYSGWIREEKIESIMEM